MTILVTGSSGHVGLTLILKLLETGQKVRALDLKKNPTIEQLPIEFIQADVRNLDTLAPAFRDVEVVYHVAAYISIQMHEWPLLEAINVNGVRNIVTLCQQYRVRRLVHFSSIEALSVEPHNKPIDETNALVPADFSIPYPRSKAAGQRIILQAIQEGLDAVTLFPTGIIGPNDYSTRASNQSLIPIANGEMPILAKFAYDWVDVRDVADGALAAAQKAPAGASYILGNQHYLITDLAVKIAALTGVPAPRVVPAWMALSVLPFLTLRSRITGQTSMLTRASLYPLLNSHQISHERASRELGYRPRSIDESLADMVNWFQKLGKIRIHKTA